MDPNPPPAHPLPSIPGDPTTCRGLGAQGGAGPGGTVQQQQHRLNFFELCFLASQVFSCKGKYTKKLEAQSGGWEFRRAGGTERRSAGHKL